jgi:hypothetical protein
MITDVDPRCELFNILLLFCFALVTTFLAFKKFGYLSNSTMKCMTQFRREESHQAVQEQHQCSAKKEKNLPDVGGVRKVS